MRRVWSSPNAFKQEHAGESVVQLSADTEMEACGDQAAATSNNFSTSLGRSQAGNLAITNVDGTIGKVRQRSLDFEQLLF